MSKPKADPTATLLKDLGELIIDGRLVKAPTPDEAPAPVKTPKEADNG